MLEACGIVCVALTKEMLEQESKWEKSDWI